MKRTLKKLTVLALGLMSIAILTGFPTSTVEHDVSQAIVCGTVPPLYQCVPAADGGFPTTAFCTMMDNNNNTLRTNLNAVTAAQAPFAMPKIGGKFTGAAAWENAGIVMGTSTGSMTGETGKIKLQTADAGVMSIGAVGNQMRVQMALPGAQTFKIENTADGGLDAGNYMHMVVQGSVVQELSSLGVYFQEVKSGNDGGYGDATTFTPESPHISFSPISVSLYPVGSFTGTEVVSVRLVAHNASDAGVSIAGLTNTGDYLDITFDGGSVEKQISPSELFTQIAYGLITKSNDFQRSPIARIVMDVKSDAGTSNVSIGAIISAYQN
jgi:hypothetical protein